LRQPWELIFAENIILKRIAGPYHSWQLAAYIRAMQALPPAPPRRPTPPPPLPPPPPGSILTAIPWVVKELTGVSQQAGNLQCTDVM